MRAKNVGRNIVSKSAKTRFLYSHKNCDQKMAEKNARNNFSKNKRIVRSIMLGKKSSQKSANTRFLYSHEYRDQKMGGKNARNNFYRNTRIVQAKNVGKKIV